ncbi:MAG: hypothetical protein M1812_000217 [Candelaria pacifica]|nr:MAG: hypothetical protein M1812_000217 [Candelaria pacifica]
MLRPLRSRAFITPLRAPAGHSGIPEVSSGEPSPPSSPPLAANVVGNELLRSGKSKARRGGAAYTITEKCERLFCETLKAVFLGEKGMADKDSLVMGAHCVQNPDGRSTGMIQLQYWVEVWDYGGGSLFRGFVVEEAKEKTLYVFFDEEVIGRDLKHGLMALLELASTPCFDCSQLVVCLDRSLEEEKEKSLMRDLGWVGFKLVTLGSLVNAKDILSDRWLFLVMEV